MLQSSDQPEIVRSNQKDEFYSSYIKRTLGEIVQSAFGPRSWLSWSKEIDVAADLLYFGLTTFAGFQTLGEEYINVIQVDASRRRIPSRLRRGWMILLQVAAPYIIERILDRLQYLLETNTYFRLSESSRQAAVLAILATRHMVSLIHRCHLAVFYISGVFYHVAKRIAGIYYIRVRGRQGAAGVDAAKSNYRILGWLSLVQLGVTFLQHLYRQQLRMTSASESGKPLLDILTNFVSSKRMAWTGAAEEASGQASDTSRKCPLCLGMRRHSTATPCGHLFCWDCITHWTSSKAECPLCRERFTSSRLIYLQNYDPV